MNIFNSLGSNYNFDFVVKSLFATGSNQDKISLENLLSKKYGGKAILLYKGREAIELALKTLNLPVDSFVAINGFTCFAVYEAIKNAGLKAMYLDLTSGDLNFSPASLKEKIKSNPKIKVVIVQNTLGYPCQIEEILKICQQNHIFLIEDLAHSVGTRYDDGSEAGTVGDLVALSFSQDKMIDGISGGALIKIDINLALHLPFRQAGLEGVNVKRQLIDRFYPLFTYLVRNTYLFKIGKIIHHLLKSFRLLSGPMDKLDNQLHQLPNWYCYLINLAFNDLPENLTQRKKIASVYVQLINPKALSPKVISAIDSSSNIRFPIFVNNRDSLIKYLKKFGVHISDIWYDAPIAPKKYLGKTSYQNQCPNAEAAAEQILNLPTHRNVSEKEAEKIAQLINQWLKSQ